MSGETALLRMSAGDVAAAVDQHQGALRAEAAKIEQVEAGDADAEARVLLAEGAAQLRQFVQRVADVGLALLEELLAADRGDRNGRFEVRPADARAGDDHFLLQIRGRVRLQLDFAGLNGGSLLVGLRNWGRLIGRCLGILRVGRRHQSQRETASRHSAERSCAQQQRLIHPRVNPSIIPPDGGFMCMEISIRTD